MLKQFIALLIAQVLLSILIDISDNTEEWKHGAYLTVLLISIAVAFARYLYELAVIKDRYTR